MHGDQPWKDSTLKCKWTCAHNSRWCLPGRNVGTHIKEYTCVISNYEIPKWKSNDVPKYGGRKEPLLHCQRAGSLSVLKVGAWFGRPYFLGQTFPDMNPLMHLASDEGWCNHIVATEVKTKIGCSLYCKSAPNSGWLLLSALVPQYLEEGLLLRHFMPLFGNSFGVINIQSFMLILSKLVCVVCCL